MGARKLNLFKSSTVQKFKVFGLLIFSVVELLNPLNLERASAQTTPFYQGKTITMVVASTVGGGYDLWARLTARHIVKYIPGNPSIVVQNMPSRAQRLFGLLKWTGDPKAVEQVALDPEFSVLESP